MGLIVLFEIEDVCVIDDLINRRIISDILINGSVLKSEKNYNLYKYYQAHRPSLKYLLDKINL